LTKSWISNFDAYSASSFVGSQFIFRLGIPPSGSLIPIHEVSSCSVDRHRSILPTLSNFTLFILILILFVLKNRKSFQHSPDNRLLILEKSYYKFNLISISIYYKSVAIQCRIIQKHISDRYTKMIDYTDHTTSIVLQSSAASRETDRKGERDRQMNKEPCVIRQTNCNNVSLSLIRCRQDDKRKTSSLNNRPIVPFSPSQSLSLSLSLSLALALSLFSMYHSG